MSPETATTAARVPRSIASPILRLRFTILFLAVMLGANLAAGTLGHALPAQILADWGIGHDTLFSVEVFRLITGTFLSHDGDMFLRQFGFAAVVIGYTEWRLGAARAAAWFFGLDIATTLLLLGCVELSTALHDLAAVNDVGMSLGGFGLIGMTIAGWHAKWFICGAILLAIGAKFCVAPDLLADAGHVLALLVGLASGSILPKPGTAGAVCHGR